MRYHWPTWRPANGVSRSQVLQHETLYLHLYKTLGTIKLLNAVLKLYFSTVCTRYNYCMSCATDHARCKRRNRKNDFELWTSEQTHDKRSLQRASSLILHISHSYTITFSFCHHGWSRKDCHLLLMWRKIGYKWRFTEKYSSTSTETGHSIWSCDLLVCLQWSSTLTRSWKNLSTVLLSQPHLFLHYSSALTATLIFLLFIN